MRDEDKSREELIRELAELRRKCERQDNILSNIYCYVLLVVSPDRTIQMCSPSVLKVFGYEEEEVVGKTTDLLYFDRRSKPGGGVGEIYRVLEKEGFHVGLATGRKKDGSTLSLEIVTGRLGGEGGGAVLLVRDISEHKMEREALIRQASALEKLVEMRDAAMREVERKLRWEMADRIRIEEESRRLREELEERVRERTAKIEREYEELKALDSLKDAFLSSVSHELRTPLTSIRSSAEILLEYSDEDVETQREFLSVIRRESERLGRLVDNLLDLSKIRAGKMEWRFENVGVGSVVRRALESVKGLVAAKQIEVETRIEPGLPPCRADRERIQQVLTNLLGNAVKYSQQGGKVRIEAEFLEGRRSGDRSDFVHLSVQDFGPGIAPEDLPLIFERYRMGAASGAGDRPKGTGLGLSICKEIVSAHGGDIWVESVLGQGSTFHVSLPAGPIGEQVPADFGVLSPLPEQKELC